jgi:hypothetical protein
MQRISYGRHRFPPEVIRHAVWLYLRFTLSYRDAEELLAERGFDISYETIRRFGHIIAAAATARTHCCFDKVPASAQDSGGGSRWSCRSLRPNRGQFENIGAVCNHQ